MVLETEAAIMANMDFLTNTDVDMDDDDDMSDDVDLVPPDDMDDDVAVKRKSGMLKSSCFVLATLHYDKINIFIRSVKSEENKVNRR